MIMKTRVFRIASKYKQIKKTNLKMSVKVMNTTRKKVSIMKMWPVKSPIYKPNSKSISIRLAKTLKMNWTSF